MKKIVFLLILIFTACSSASSNNVSAVPDLEIGIPVTKNGEILDVSTPEGWNSYKIGKPISIMLSNVSSKKVILQSNYGIKIFALRDGKWTEVNNQMVYVNSEDVVLYPHKSGDPLDLQSVMLLPEITSSEDTYLRIYIVGKIAKDNNLYEQFSSYVDVVIHP